MKGYLKGEYGKKATKPMKGKKSSEPALRRNKMPNKKPKITKV